MAENESYNIFGTTPIPKLIMKFAAPSVIALLVNALYNIVDQIFIGQYVGYLGNAATTVVFPITIIAVAFSHLIGDGTAAYFSLQLGAGNKKEAEHGVNSGFAMLVIMGFIVLALCTVFLKPILLLFGASENVLPYAMEYGGVIAMGLPLVIIGNGLNASIRADGSPHIAMISMFIGAVANTILDPICINTFGWGVRGAAIATIFGQFLTFAMGIWYLLRFKNIKIRFKQMIPNLRILRIISTFGVSSFITQLSIILAQLTLNNMLNMYGALSKFGSDIPLAVWGIESKVTSILNAFLVGIGSGAQPIIGYNYGAKKFKRTKQTYLATAGIASVVAIIFFAVVMIFTQPIINLFGKENELYNEFAHIAFRSFLLLVFLNGFQIVTGTFFQSIGKPVKAAIIVIARMFIAMIPMAIILPRFYGVAGIMYSGAIADGLAFVVALTLSIIKIKKINKGILETESSAVLKEL